MCDKEANNANQQTNQPTHTAAEQQSMWLQIMRLIVEKVAIHAGQGNITQKYSNYPINHRLIVEHHHTYRPARSCFPTRSAHPNAHASNFGMSNAYNGLCTLCTLFARPSRKLPPPIAHPIPLYRLMGLNMGRYHKCQQIDITSGRILLRSVTPSVVAIPKS